MLFVQEGRLNISFFKITLDKAFHSCLNCLVDSNGAVGYVPAAFLLFFLGSEHND